jgi:hypothetical protein
MVSAAPLGTAEHGFVGDSAFVSGPKNAGERKRPVWNRHMRDSFGDVGTTKDARGREARARSRQGMSSFDG